MSIVSRVKQLMHSWNVFRTLDSRDDWNIGASYGHRPDRTRFSYSNERTIITSIYTRIAIDVSAVEIRHVREDSDHRYVEEIDSGLNNCLTLEANVDQASRAFIQDIVLTMFNGGTAAIVPVDTSVKPIAGGGFDIKTMRVGEVVAWHPRHVRVRLYNDKDGVREDIVVDKRTVAIVDNPFYGVMNEPNSTLQRLIRKLNLLDAVDEASSSGKLDLIIQLPYVVKSEARRQQAEQRRKDIEFQLKGSKYGIAYTDGTEKVVQLNRPAENNLLKEIEYLVEMVYGQLGITPEVMNGTADEKVMLNYKERTIEPLLGAISQAMKRTFLTKTARSQGQTIMYFRNPFALMTMADLAEIADKFTRSEVATSNDLRTVIGWKPSKDPKANELRNTNMPEPVPAEDSSAAQSAIDSVNQDLDDLFSQLGIDENAVV